MSGLVTSQVDRRTLLKAGALAVLASPFAVRLAVTLAQQSPMPR